ncbi:MAG: HAD-IC family P-type ATPase [Candidatus Paceibacterota bacterium]|jgi:Mg2+-importing ATPase
MKFSDYAVKDTEEVIKELQTSEGGLSGREAENRLKARGFNEIKAKETGLIGIFFRQFRSPFFYLLFAAAVLAFLIRGNGDKTDGIVIMVFIIVNAALGFLQESRAHRAVSLLKKYFSARVRVLRNGVEANIDKKFLVPGDIALLEAGDIIPADIRLLKTENFLIDESVLSGESAPLAKNAQKAVKKDQEMFEAENIAFAGTSAISGKAQGAVIATGKNTVFGEITKLVSGASRESAYEKSLFRFSSVILRIVVATILLIFLADLFINKGRSNFSEFLVFSIALIVSILPEALPLVVTFALSQGAMKMAKEKVVVKRLSAIEDLGNIEILCSDKTGTLTENKLRLEKIFSGDKDKCLLFSLLTSSIIKEEVSSSLNPFDLAQLEQMPGSVKNCFDKFKEISDLPFDNIRMMSSALVENEKGEMILIVKGAAEIVLEACSGLEGSLTRETVIEELRKEGKQGRRTLGVAFKKMDKREYSQSDEKGLTFLGFFSFVDPLKKTAREAIRSAQKMGIKIKILTGDSKEVAAAIAQQVGLIRDPRGVVLDKELDVMSEYDFMRACENFSVFARVSPQTKLNIIKSLQKKFEVGFLGEGINDTPALKMANVGIVVKEAADVPREAADVVLLEKDLRVIINGIKNGRSIFSNINKYIKCALASNFGNFYSIALISLLIPFLSGVYYLPILSIQILLGNLLSDFPLISIATDSIDPEELKKPRYYQLGQSVPLIISLALVSMVFDFIFFAIFYRSEPGMLQTLWFIESILTEISLIFVIRTRHLFFKAKRPGFALMLFTILDALIIFSLPFTALGREFFHFVVPPVGSLLIILLLVAVYFALSETVKLIYFHRVWKDAPAEPAAD